MSIFKLRVRLFLRMFAILWLLIRQFSFWYSYFQMIADY